MMIRPVNPLPLKARLFRALGDDTRLSILEALAAKQHRVTDLVPITGQSQSAVSTHLAALHAAGLVTRRQEARQAWYSLAHPSVMVLLAAVAEIVQAASEEAYACVSPCCSAESPVLRLGAPRGSQ